MNKFTKRLKKSSPRVENALVLGSAFGNLEDILSVYNTVFVIGDERPTVKGRNLVYRGNFDHLNQLTEISVILIDLDRLYLLDVIKDVWQRNESVVVIEGDEPISREFSKPLYDTNWGCRQKQGFFHTWEKLK